MPLKNVPKCLSPNLLHALASMGHGDEIVLADAHFPTSSICKSGPLEIRADGVDIPTLLDGILHLLPLDAYVKCPVALMDPVQSDKDNNIQIPVWDKYKEILKSREGPSVGQLDRITMWRLNLWKDLPSMTELKQPMQ
ncbi:fucose mutarotase-like isoform X2 [Crassostrea virginica]